MLPSFILSLREGLEAALIIGIVLGTLRKINRPDLRPAVWSGAAVAVLTSLLAAWGLNRLGAEFEGRAEQLYEGIAMLLAAGILTWMIFWMQKQSGFFRQHLEDQVHQSVKGGNRAALFILAFLTIAREGLELALFLFAAQLATNRTQTLVGALLGLAGAALLGWMVFVTTRRLSLIRFFQVTSLFLLVFAAGLVAYSIHEFNEAGLVPPIIEHVWDINFLLDENSTLGQFLKVLFGYNGNPSLTEMLSYIFYIAVLLYFLRSFFLRKTDFQTPG